MLRRIRIAILILYASNPGFAQLDVEHFLPPLTSSTHKFIGNAGAGFQVIYLSTPSKDPVNFTIYNGAGTVLHNGTVSNNTPKTYGGEGPNQMHGLNTPLMVNQANLNKVLSNKGIRIVSDAPIYCNLRIRSPNNAQAASITAKGKTALGTTFRLGHIPTPQKASNWGLQSIGSKLATVGFYASEDNTTITIDLTKVKPKLWGPNAPNTNTPFSITLQKGQTYTLALRNQDAPNRNAGAGFSGGLVTSNKPIVVNCASMGGYLSNTWQADFGADQIVPLKEVGTKYAVVRGASNDNNLEQVMIVAHENGTEIKVNGVVVKTLNAGQIYKIHGSKYTQGSMYIETSKPAYAYQMMMGSNSRDKKTPGMNFIPPISCKTSNYVDNIPLVHKIGNTNYKGTVSVVTTKTGSNLELYRNGTLRNDLLGTPRNVPNSDYKYYKISNLTGNIAVYSKTIALVSFTGYNGAAGFGGYFSGWQEGVVEDSVTCLPGYVFELSGRYDSYRWFKNGVEIPDETNDSLFATETGYYQYEYTKGACTELSDSIWAVGLTEFQLQGDTFFCPKDSVKWEIVGSGFDSIAWQGGNKSQQLWINKSGQTNVRIYSDVAKECYVDTHVITIKNPIPSITLRDTTVCNGEKVILDAQNIGSSYTWNTNATTQTIEVVNSGTYKVVVTNSAGCSDSTSMNFTVKSCNTDAEVTKTDYTDKYYSGATTIYTIIARNNGPADIEDGIISDPLPTGISSNDVSWTATTFGSASSSVSGTNHGALQDTVNIPFGDSIVYTVNISIPINFVGDLKNTVSITANNDTFPDNNIATDINIKDCNFKTAGSINAKNAGWVKIGNVIVGVPYQISSTGGTNTFVAHNGPSKGDSVTSIIYNTSTGYSVSLQRNRYDNQNAYFNTIGSYDKTPHAWTGLSGNGDETAPILGFMAFIDQNRNGKYDSGLEEYYKDISSLNFKPNTTGELYMAFYDDGIYSDNNGIININVQSQLESTNLGADTTICVGDSVILDAQNPDAVSWVWSTGDTTRIISAARSGQYSVEVTSAGGCDVQDTINIQVSGVDVTIPTDTAFCENESLIITASSDSATTWHWNTGSSSPTIEVDSTGNYSIIVANSLGCMDSADITVTVHPNPDVNLRTDTAFCAGNSILLDAQNTGSNYLWNTGATSQTITADSTGRYIVWVTNEFGCSNSDTMNLLVHPLPNLDLGPDIELCYPDSVTINGGDFTSYLWSNGSTNSSVVATETEKIFLDVFNNNGCSASDTILFISNPLPVVNLGNDTAICYGDSIVLDAKNSGGLYLWSNSKQTQSITVKETGVFHVMVANNKGCVGYDTLNLKVNPNPQPDLGQDTAICQGDSITFQAGVWSAYSWNDKSSKNSLTANTSGLYFLDIVDTNGCMGSDSVSLEIYPKPKVDLGPDQTICKGNKITLDAGNPGATYNWSTLEFTQTIVIEKNGNYNVTVIDSNGCVASDDFVLKLDSIVDPFPKKTDTICEGASAIFEPDPKYLFYDISWLNSIEGNSIEVSSNGTYHSVVKSEYCIDTFEVKLNVIDTPEFFISDIRNKSTYCFDLESTKLIANSYTNLNYEYAWLPTRTEGPQKEIVEAGTYIVETKNAGCTARSSITLTNYCPAKVYIPNAFTPNKDFTNDGFKPVLYGEIYNYELLIFNRWGELIWSTNDTNEAWDGTINGRDAQIDVYVYKIIYEIESAVGNMEKNTAVGRVSLIR